MIIAPVTVRCKNDHKQVTTYAFIDNGCGAAFCIGQEFERQHKQDKASDEDLNSGRTGQLSYSKMTRKLLVWMEGTYN